MKKKKIYSIVVTFIFLIQIFSSFTPISSVKAAGTDVSSQIATDTSNTDLSITTSDGQPINPDASGNYSNVPKDAKISIKYAFNLLDNNGVPDTDSGYKEYSYSAGDYYKVTMPSQLKFNPLPSDGKALDGGIGTLTLNGSDATVTFSDYVESHSSMVGHFELNGTFSDDIVNSQNPQPISFTFNGKTININFVQAPPPDTSVNIGITKSGVYNSSDNTIEWTVILTPDAGKTANDVSLEDVYGDNQSYVDGSLTVNGGSDNSNLTVDTANRKFTYTFPGGISDAQTIVYKTKAVDNAFAAENSSNKSVVFNNTATVNESGTPKGTASGNVSLDWIKKSGQQDTSNPHIIHWTIDVDNSNESITNPVIKDVIPTGIDLDPASVKLGNDSVTQGTGFGEYNYDSGTKTFSYKFNGSITGKQTISYDTMIPDADLNNNTLGSYTNSASLTWDEIGTLGSPSDSASVGIGQGGVITKYAETTMDYVPDSSGNGIIHWTIDVNKNNINIINAALTDTLPASLQYVSGSCKVDGSNVDPADPSDGKFSSSAGTISYNFGDINGISHKVTFDTKITDYTNLFANGNANYGNSATLTGGGISGGTQDSTGTQNFNSQVIDKSVAVAYNYATRKTTWKIVVNKNEIPLSLAKVTDTIPAGMKFLSDTFKVTDKDGTDVTSIIGGTLTSDVKAEDNIADSDSFTYQFPASISSTYTITYETELKEKYLQDKFSSRDFTNNSTLTTLNYPGSINSSAKVSVKNLIVEKSAGYTTGASYISWIVPINEGALNLQDVSISDPLQSPDLVLDTDSVKLYNMTLNSDGTLTKGSPVPDNEYSFTYDKNTNKFTINLGNISTPYQLEFSTDVVTDNPNINNSISFDGTGITNTSAAIVSVINVSNVGGGGSGTSGSVTVTKVDKDTLSPLSGAVFQLYDINQNPIDGKIGTTDSNGKLTFNLLRFRTYYVKEIKAPAGYNISDNTMHKFKLTSTSPVYSEAFSDERLVGNSTTVWFTKTGEDSDSTALSGAEFTLYKSDGITPVTDGSGKNITAISGTDGKVEFNYDVPYGYKIIETKAPTGYSINSNPLTAILDGSSNIVLDANSIADTKIRNDVQFVKKDKNGNPLKGAEFKLYKNDDVSFQNPIQTSASDGNGIVKFTNAAYGYKIKETTPPTGYNLSDKVLTVTMNQDGKSVQLGEDNNTVTDSIMTGNITFTKTGEDADAAGLKGAEFTLYNEDGTTRALDSKGNVISPVTSGDNGVTTFVNVPYGKYKILETNKPKNYNAYDTAINVDLTKITEDGQTVDLDTIKDTKIRNDIQFKKVDQSGNPLKGAVFTLYKIGEDGKTLTAVKNSDDKDLTAASGADDAEGAAVTTGNVIFSNVEYGSYEIKETMPPSGYYLSSTPLYANISVNKSVDSTPAYARPAGDTTSGLYSISDTRITGGGSIGIQGTINVKKTDESGNSLKGAVFTLFNSNGNPVQIAVTDANGIAQFTKVSPGKYTVKETVAPAGGYTISTQVIPVEINMSKTYNLGTVKDTKNAASIEVKKTDASGNVLSGAEFALYNGDVKVASVVSGQDGIAKFSNVVYGNYTIKETKSPEGYNLNKNTLSVKVDSSKIYQFTVVDGKETPTSNNPSGTTNSGNLPGTTNSNNSSGTTNYNNHAGRTPNQNNSPGGTSNGNISSILPKTGAIVDTTVLLVIGVIVILAGIGLVVKSKKLEKHR